MRDKLSNEIQTIINDLILFISKIYGDAFQYINQEKEVSEFIDQLYSQDIYLDDTYQWNYEYISIKLGLNSDQIQQIHKEWKSCREKLKQQQQKSQNDLGYSTLYPLLEKVFLDNNKTRQDLDKQFQQIIKIFSSKNQKIIQSFLQQNLLIDQNDFLIYIVAFNNDENSQKSQNLDVIESNNNYTSIIRNKGEIQDQFKTIQNDQHYVIKSSNSNESLNENQVRIINEDILTDKTKEEEEIYPEIVQNLKNKLFETLSKKNSLLKNSEFKQFLDWVQKQEQDQIDDWYDNLKLSIDESQEIDSLCVQVFKYFIDQIKETNDPEQTFKQFIFCKNNNNKLTKENIDLLIETLISGLQNKNNQIIEDSLCEFNITKKGKKLILQKWDGEEVAKHILTPQENQLKNILLSSMTKSKILSKQMVKSLIQLHQQNNSESEDKITDLMDELGISARKSIYQYLKEYFPQSLQIEDSIDFTKKFHSMTNEQNKKINNNQKNNKNEKNIFNDKSIQIRASFELKEENKKQKQKQKQKDQKKIIDKSDFEDESQKEILTEYSKETNEKSQYQKELILERVKQRSNNIVQNQQIILLQQEDHCLDQVSLKILCQQNNINDLIKQVKINHIKLVGLYGDFKTSMKILKQYYPRAKQFQVDKDYINPLFDRLVGYTDGEIIILVYEECQNSFEQDVFENDDGILYIRYLLDTCHIVIACLNEHQIKYWTDKCPFEDFTAAVPPQLIKDRSAIIVKEVQIKSNVTLNKYKLFVSRDQNNVLFRWKLDESKMLDSYQTKDAFNKIELNEKHISNYIQNIRQKYQMDKSLSDLHFYENQICKIFSKNAEIQKSIMYKYTNFKENLIKVLNSIQFSLANAKKAQEQIYEQPFTEKSQLEKDIQDYEKSSSELFLNRLDKNSVQCRECLNSQKTYCNNRCIRLSQILYNLQKELRVLFSNPHQIWAISSFFSIIYTKDSLKYKSCQITDIINEYNKNSKQFVKNLKNVFYNDNFRYQFQQQWHQFKESLMYSRLTINNKEIGLIYEFIYEEITKETIKVLKQNIEWNIRIKNDAESLFNIFKSEIREQFELYKNEIKQKIFISPLTIKYDSVKNECFMSVIQALNDFTLPSQAHSILDYVSYNDEADYIVTCNSNDTEEKRKVTVWVIKKNKKGGERNIGIRMAFEIPGYDIAITINSQSKQWVIFENSRKKHSIGRIQSDYLFEEGRININVYNCKIYGFEGNIKRVDSCTILNEIENTVFLYEKQSQIHFELSLNGKISVKDFSVYQTNQESTVVALDDQIFKVNNNPDNDIYIMETKNMLYITNPNYTIKNQIKIDPLKYQNYKLIQTETKLILAVFDKYGNIKTYSLDGDEDENISENNTILSDNEPQQKLTNKRKGNVVIDKLIKAMHNYGINNQEIGCIAENNLLIYFESSFINERTYGIKENQLLEKIYSYIIKCIESKNIKYKLKYSEANNFESIEKMICKIEELMISSSLISKESLQFLMLTRVPIQLTTIQQSNYIPLKDGLFNEEFLNLKKSDQLIEELKKRITFGQYEELLEKCNQKIQVISMCGRQSVGKSSQLNRMFGTRFGVSAARCTDGIWLGLSKNKENLIIVLDCEGLFSIRRSEEEELKLLQQITLISDVCIVFCDLEGISQPLIDLFKKLQLCVGKKKGEGIYFQGTLMFLTKNIQDQGDQQHLQAEFKSYTRQKNISQTLHKIFQKGISYCYLKHFHAQDYDLNLVKVRDEGIYENIFKKTDKNLTPSQTLAALKYSEIQIYLDDDSDIELISKLSEIEGITEHYKKAFLNISLLNFSDENLQINFEYIPTSEQEEIIINDKIYNFQEMQRNQVINKQEYDTFEREVSSFEQKEFPEDLDEVKQKQILSNSSIKQNDKIGRYLKLGQDAIEFTLQNELEQIFTSTTNTSNNRYFVQTIFEQNYHQLQIIDHDRYFKQLQKFLTTFIQNRKNLILQSYEGKLPKQQKFQEICNKYKMELVQLIEQFIQEFKICLKQCKICDRCCVKEYGHTNNCNCDTTHTCSKECEICKSHPEKISSTDEEGLEETLPIGSSRDCFLISGHKGMHYCRTVNHLCGEQCQISPLCKNTCTLGINHDNVEKHDCQNKHKCIHQCRLYDKCQKTCSLPSGHTEDFHICESDQCYNKCSLCNNRCAFKHHDHDLLLFDIEKNKELLTLKIEEDGNIKEYFINDHLCGENHVCKNKCEKEGTCKITYETEEHVWQKDTTSKFSYIYQKPIQTQNECTKVIPAWHSVHDGLHECDQTHRCCEQCPECLSFCASDFGHNGNHNTKSHRNKEMCIFVDEKNDKQIEIETEGTLRQYKVGEKATPETCYESCNRQGRAHYHLRECSGGGDCAAKLYPTQARHSKKIFYPYTEKQYDEILCKAYWNSLKWDTPLHKDREKEYALCNWACSHDSHTLENINYCSLQAWHKDLHMIDSSKCEHKGTQSGLIDICFTIDTTASMGWAIPKVKDCVKKIMKKFNVDSNSIQIGIVCYRDHPPQDNTYLTQVYNLNTEEQIVKIIDSITAGGGGDGPEAVMDGLRVSTNNIKWRNLSQRFIFHISDSPPHGKEYGGTSHDKNWEKNGCPCGTQKENIAQLLKVKEINYYMIKCSPQLNLTEILFKAVFGTQFKQCIDLKDYNKLQFEILEVLNKEITINKELYHLQKH